MYPTKEEARQMATVLGAMRLALVGAPNDAEAVKLVALLLDEAPPSAPDDTAGVELFVRLLKERRVVASACGQERSDG